MSNNFLPQPQCFSILLFLTDDPFGNALCSHVHGTKQKITMDDIMGVNRWCFNNITGNLCEVPGILDDMETVDKLDSYDVDESECISSTHQLIGKYLMLHRPGEMTFTDLNKKFSHFLQERGITLHRPYIVRAISEKVASFFPGFHDGSEFNYK
jgi:hypothetical protein